MGAYACRAMKPQWILGLVALLPQGGQPAEQPYGFSCGLGAELLEQVAAELDRASLPTPSSEWPTWELEADGGWCRPAPWRRWSELVREEQERSTPDADARSQLAHLALAQDRHRDAWRHLLSLAHDPPAVAALLPAFLPGVPARSPSALPSGVALTPALPPPPLEGEQPLERRMSVAAFQVGKARVSMEVSLEADGVQIDLSWLGGEGTSFTVRPPVPPGTRFHAVYVDWEDAPTPLAIPVELGPGQTSSTIWARYRRQRVDWPTQVPKELSAPLRSHGLILQTESDHPAVRDFLDGLGTALGELFQLPHRLAIGAPAGSQSGPGVTLSFEEGALLPKAAAMVSSAEAFLFSTP